MCKLLNISPHQHFFSLPNTQELLQVDIHNLRSPTPRTTTTGTGQEEGTKGIKSKDCWLAFLWTEIV